MRFINDDHTILFEKLILSCFSKEYTVSHKFDSGVFVGFIVKTNLIGNKISVCGKLSGNT